MYQAFTLRAIEGSKNYKLVMPGKVPVRDFWAITTYDLENASYLRVIDKSSIDSTMKDVKKNSDGSVDVYFGPTPPKGKESNWLPADSKPRSFQRRPSTSIEVGLAVRSLE